MNNKQFIEERKQDLLNQKGRLEKELSLLAQKDNGNYKPKFPTIGNEDEDNELEVAEYDETVDAEKHLEEILNETKSALQKIEKGTYGYCENCKQKIDEARLKAHPQAATCLKCTK